MDQLPRLGKRELICLLLFTCNYVVSVWRGFLFLWVLGMGYVILLWHSLSLPYQRTNGPVNAHLTFFPVITTTVKREKGQHQFFRCSRAANSVVHDQIWPNFKLIKALIYVIITCKYEKDLIKNS